MVMGAVRTRPPLEYVAEKVRHTLEALLSRYRVIHKKVPEDLSVGQPFAEAAVSVKKEYLLPNPA